MTHYDEESLLRFVEGGSPIAGEIELHVTSCSACAVEVDQQRELIVALAAPETWEVPPPPPSRTTFDLRAFAEHARLEDEQAAGVCREILSGPSSWWPQRLRANPGARTAGMVRQLLVRMRALLESSPVNALQATALAVEVANALDAASYPADCVVRLRAQAARDHAYVLTFLGRYREALEVAERAGRLFDQVPVPEYDLARLALVKASALQYLDRLAEADRLTEEAAETFFRFGDRGRAINARITQGSIAYQSGAADRALAIWQDTEGDVSLDATSAARVAHNIALALTDLGRHEEAAPYVARCVAEFEMLGMETERTRSRWMLARALVALGKTAEAIPALRQSWREFERLEMIGDAGLVALELAEALLISGDSTAGAEVPAICRDVIAQFTRAGMASRAITALSFLREAVAIGQASPSLFRHVHAFLRELPGDQPRLSAPPPGGAGT